MSPDLFWIPGPWLGKLAVSTRPRGGDWLDDEVSGLRNAGIHLLVSLLERDEAAQLELEGEGKIAESQGVRFVSFPIPDRGVPASTLEALSLFSALTLALGQGKNVAVHCRQGLGRSGLITAGLLVMSGIGVEQAIESVSCARGQAIPETLAQRNWIQQLSERPVLAS
jgi:protein-tyrosine phosphatase